MFIVDFRKEYIKVADAVNSLKESFDQDGCSNSGPLNTAIAETSNAYRDIASMFQQQPRRDWMPLGDNLHVYKGIISGFDATLGAQKVPILYIVCNCMKYIVIDDTYI